MFHSLLVIIIITLIIIIIIIIINNTNVSGALRRFNINAVRLTNVCNDYANYEENNDTVITIIIKFIWSLFNWPFSTDHSNLCQVPQRSHKITVGGCWC